MGKGKTEQLAEFWRRKAAVIGRPISPDVRSLLEPLYLQTYLDEGIDLDVALEDFDQDVDRALPVVEEWLLGVAGPVAMDSSKGTVPRMKRERRLYPAKVGEHLELLDFVIEQRLLPWLVRLASVPRRMAWTGLCAKWNEAYPDRPPLSPARLRGRISYLRRSKRLARIYVERNPQGPIATGSLQIPFGWRFLAALRPAFPNMRMTPEYRISLKAEMSQAAKEARALAKKIPDRLTKKALCLLADQLESPGDRPVRPPAKLSFVLPVRLRPGALTDLARMEEEKRGRRVHRAAKASQAPKRRRARPRVP